MQLTSRLELLPLGSTANDGFDSTQNVKTQICATNNNFEPILTHGYVVYFMNERDIVTSQVSLVLCVYWYVQRKNTELRLFTLLHFNDILYTELCGTMLNVQLFVSTD